MFCGSLLLFTSCEPQITDKEILENTDAWLTGARTISYDAHTMDFAMQRGEREIFDTHAYLEFLPKDSILEGKYYVEYDGGSYTYNGVQSIKTNTKSNTVINRDGPLLDHM